MSQLKVLDGGNHGRLIMAKDDLRWGLRRKLWRGLWNLTMNIIYMKNMTRIKSKKISDDQELIQSDPVSCPQNQKGNN